MNLKMPNKKLLFFCFLFIFILSLSIVNAACPEGYDIVVTNDGSVCVGKTEISCIADCTGSDVDVNDVQSCKSKCNTCSGISSCTQSWGQDGGGCTSNSDCGSNGLVCGINSRCQSPNDPNLKPDCSKNTGDFFGKTGYCGNTNECIKENQCCYGAECDSGECVNHICSSNSASSSDPLPEFNSVLTVILMSITIMIYAFYRMNKK